MWGGCREVWGSNLGGSTERRDITDKDPVFNTDYDGVVRCEKLILDETDTKSVSFPPYPESCSI